jgi:cytochrome P450
MGSPDITLTTEDSTSFPTADCQVWTVHEDLHRNPAYWPDPDTYRPERWLVGPEDPLDPPKGAWRTFEHGPRTCIRQNLA